MKLQWHITAWQSSTEESTYNIQSFAMNAEGNRKYFCQFFLSFMATGKYDIQGGWLYWEDGKIKVVDYGSGNGSLPNYILFDTLEAAQDIAQAHHDSLNEITQVENLVKELKHEVSA